MYNLYKSNFSNLFFSSFNNLKTLILFSTNLPNSLIVRSSFWFMVLSFLILSTNTDKFTYFFSLYTFHFFLLPNSVG